MPELESLRDVFRRYPDIEAVYLFGSRAARNAQADSDLDLAIVPARDACREQRLEILTDLARAGFDEVDLLFLNGDDLVLAYEAVRPNEVVYQTDDFDRGAYYSRVVRMYLDFLPYLEVQREAYRREVLRGQS